MRLLLPYIFVMIVIFNFLLRRGSNKQEQRTKAFWDKESKANLTRKQDISKLNYITIPNNLPQLNEGDTQFDLAVSENKTLMRRFEELESLREKKILNLSSISNTDLKMEYGAANLTELSSYDDNYTTLIKNLSTIGHELINLGFKDKAAIYLETGIELGTDIKSNYYDLASLYIETNNDEKLAYLIKKAEELESINKEVIIEQLQEMSDKRKVILSDDY
ncbi:MAG: hypothetical protein K6F41_02795 [Lachnospira sp.]|nr:hypothetical protein [Lachnospira sp.]